MTLTTKIKRQIRTYMEADSVSGSDALAAERVKENSTLHHKQRRQRPTEKTGEVLQRTVSAKLADGDVQGAIRLLASSEEIA